MRRFLVLCVCVVTFGCADTRAGKPAAPQTYFALGQVVKHKPSGFKGQVVRVWEGYSPVQYDVRFAVDGCAGRMIGLVTETLYEFEIQAE